jgi:hypothetical protein
MLFQLKMINISIFLMKTVLGTVNQVTLRLRAKMDLIQMVVSEALGRKTKSTFHQIKKKFYALVGSLSVLVFVLLSLIMLLISSLVGH